MVKGMMRREQFPATLPDIDGKSTNVDAQGVQDFAQDKDTEHGERLDANQSDANMDPEGLLEDTDEDKGAGNDKSYLHDAANTSWWGRRRRRRRYVSKSFTYKEIIGESLKICEFGGLGHLGHGVTMPKVGRLTGEMKRNIKLESDGGKRNGQCVYPSYETTGWPFYIKDIKWWHGLFPGRKAYEGCRCFAKFIERCQPDATTSDEPGTAASDRRRTSPPQTMSHPCMHWQLCSCKGLCNGYKKAFGCPAPALIDSPYGLLQQQMESKQNTTPPEAMANTNDTKEQVPEGDGLMQRSMRIRDKEASASLDETLEDKCQA